MRKRGFLLEHIKKDGAGLEIGPSHSPVAPKRDGYQVEVVDHLDRDGLIEKYRHHGVDLDAIEEVDYVWAGQPYSELIGESKRFDWIVACHVIEHTPDFISFLNDCECLLKDDGVLLLAIPDKRYCFDYFRPITGLSQVIDAFDEKKKVHSPGSVAEYFLNVVKMNGKIAWNEHECGGVSFIHGAVDAKKWMSFAREGSYIDVHAWCFVPHSFRLLLSDLFELGFTALKEVDYQSCGITEFYVALSNSGNGPEITRQEMQMTILQELKDNAPIYGQSLGPLSRLLKNFRARIKSI